MAKKKATQSASELHAERDEAFLAIHKQAAARDGREEDIISDSRSLPCLPFPSLLLRYLFKLEGFPLCRVYQLRGPKASFKSTTAVEIGRWHRLHGGYGSRAETEHKENVALTDMVLFYDSDWFYTHEARSVEDWQKYVTKYFAGAKQFCNRVGGPGRTVPVFCIVDSLAGNLSESTMQKIRKDGHATRRFPVEAMALTDYIKFLPQEIAGWPFTFIGVNHRKLDLAAAEDGMTRYRSPGGDGFGYFMSFGIDMEKRAVERFANHSTAHVRMSMDKNSYGPEFGSIEVGINFWQQEDEPGVWRQYCRYEWWAGSIYLLRGDYFNTKQAELWQGKLKEVVDIHEKASGSLGKMFWSEALGVPSSEAMPAHDLGYRLEQRPDLLVQIYDIFGIHRVHFFQDGISFVSQMDEYAYMVAQADAATQSRDKKEAVGVGQARVPIKRRPDAEAEA